VLPGDLDQAEAEAFVEAHGGVLAQDAEAERRVALTAGVLDQCCEERGPTPLFRAPSLTAIDTSGTDSETNP